VKLWCADPKDTIELFLNYDTDVCMTGPVQLVPGTRWKLFQRLCTSLTHIAEQCGEYIGQQIQKSRDLQHKTLDHGEAVRLLRTTSLETISQIVKSLAVAAAASCATSDKFSRLLASWNPGEPPYALSPSKSSKNGGEKQVLGFWRDVIAAEQQDRLSSVAPTQQESRQIALEIAKRKSLKKAIEYLIACNGLSPSPRDVANFLRLHKDELDPSSLGEYISETGVGPETEWWKAMRHSYVRAISFVGMKVEEGYVPILGAIDLIITQQNTIIRVSLTSPSSGFGIS
jgi:Sec7 domain